jgi:RNA polymerase sigma-70 factor (ECF subfamily)
MTTRWSRVLRAGDPETKDAQQALEELCRDYWKPLAAFAQRKGHSPEDAQDLTQAFIAKLLATNSFGKADRERGRFRTFLLSAFCNFMVGDHRAQKAQKRGGAQTFVSLDDDTAESHHVLHPQDHMTPEREYERSWAVALLERVMQRLQGDYERAERLALYAAIQPHLAGGNGRPNYARLGESIGMSESAITVAVHRMRKRYGLLLREEIAATVATPGDVEDELRYLMNVVAAPSGQ